MTHKVPTTHLNLSTLHPFPSLLSVSGQTLEDEIADLSEKLDVSPQTIVPLLAPPPIMNSRNILASVIKSINTSLQQVTQRTIRAVCASHATAAGDKFEEVMSVSHVAACSLGTS